MASGASTGGGTVYLVYNINYAVYTIVRPRSPFHVCVLTGIVRRFKRGFLNRRTRIRYSFKYMCGSNHLFIFWGVCFAAETPYFGKGRVYLQKTMYTKYLLVLYPWQTKATLVAGWAWAWVKAHAHATELRWKA
eukprot:COSAG01_NODE_566_length_15422_cov_8.342622_8_plen_134_part_00